MPEEPKTIHIIVRSLATKKRADLWVKAWEVRESRDPDWKWEAWLSYYAVRKLGNLLGDEDCMWRMVKPIKDGRVVVRGIVNRRLMFGEKEKKMKRLLKTSVELADEKIRERFVAGWRAAGGPDDDADSATPWCAPWEWTEYISIIGNTPEEWGASHYAANKEEIEDLRYREEIIKSLEESND